MKVNICLLLIFLLVANVLAVDPIRLPPITDWNKAYKHAKAGQTVQLVLRDAKMDGTAKSIRVFIADNGKRYYVASVVPFPKDSTGSFLLDLSQVLEKLPKAPSPDTKIIITGGSYKTLEINLR